MTSVFIVHVAEGSPQENWLPWLRKELDKLGCKIYIPKFPTPKDQNLEAWMQEFLKYGFHLEEDNIFVGHSLGVLFLLHLLEFREAKASFLVSGFDELPGNKYDKGMKSFVKKFDYEKIKKNCKKFYIYHSDTDKIVDISKAEKLAKNLDTKVILVKDAGHINASAGYTKFEVLLKDIKKELNSK